MSVFTPLSLTQIQHLLDAEGLTVRHFSAATEGIENSNFFIAASDSLGNHHELVLTIIENLGIDETRWSQQLLTQLSNEGLAVPAPIGKLQYINHKPVALAPRLPGQHPQMPTPAQATAIGRFLGKLHRSRFNTPSPMADERQRLRQLAQYLPLLPASKQTVAGELLQRWLATNGQKRLIHGDLFRDNALFIGDQLSAVIDFYNASFELPVYDLAVALNDWALTPDGHQHDALAAALLDGYQQIAPLANPALLPLACAVAALRFWLSRLQAEQSAIKAQAGRGSKPADEFAKKFTLRLDQLEAAG